MKQIQMYTDGSCLGNPGPGGWACILKFNKHESTLKEGKKLTTNNEMELLAVVEGIEALTEPCSIELWSDSKYVLDAISKWLKNWEAKGWITSTRKPVANKELWIRYTKAIKPHTIKCNWVKGHSGHPENERCDKLAFDQATSYKNK